VVYIHAIHEGLSCKQEHKPAGSIKFGQVSLFISCTTNSLLWRHPAARSWLNKRPCGLCGYCIAVKNWRRPQGGWNFVSWTWKTTAIDTFSLSVPFHTMLQTNHSAVTVHNWKLEI